MFKRGFVSTLVAATMAIGALGATVQPSSAGPIWHHGHGHGGHGHGGHWGHGGHGHGGHWGHGGLGLGLGVGGFLLGSALAQPRVVVVDEYGGGHVQRCLARYRSYDPRTDTYIGKGGQIRYCRL